MWDGTVKNIEDIEKGDVVASYKDGKIKPDIVKKAWYAGEKECFQVNDRIVLTKDHRVLSENMSWRKVEDARTMICPNELPFGEVHNPELGEFIGLMITDGSVRPNQSPKFTNINPEILNRFRYLVKNLYPEVSTKEYKNGNGFDIIMTSCVGGESRKKGHFLRNLFFDSNTIPDIVWEFDKESTLAFFAGVIAGDGSISCKESKTPRGYMALSSTLIIEAGTSEQLAKDYQTILTKFGVKTKVKKDKRGNNHRVYIYSTKSIRRLSGIEIPCDYKQSKFEYVLSVTKENKESNTRKENIKRFEPVGSKSTYDIETSFNNCFIANGYIVHNSGKDKTLINLITKESLKRKGTYFYFLPTYAQGRKIIWDGMDRDGFKFLDHIPQGLRLGENGTEMKITLINGSIIQIIGSDNIDSVMGTNPVGCVFSEFSLQDPRGWDFVRPILRENNGFALFNYTPRGHNHAWDLHMKNLDNPEWFCEVLTVDDTGGCITKEDIDEERRSGMAEDLIQQEFYCSYEAALPGAYYADQMRKMREDKRITKVPVQEGILVNTAWDIGIGDETSIWFYQNVGREIHIVDFYEESGESLSHYVEILKKKDYMYGRHFAPHDMKVRELGTGKSRQEVARNLGIKFDIARKLKVEDGIDAVRRMLSYCWIDVKKCSRGIDALYNYRKEYDERNKIFHTRPVHDWASHAADAIRTMAVTHSFYPTSRSKKGSWDEYSKHYKYRKKVGFMVR